VRQNDSDACPRRAETGLQSAIPADQRGVTDKNASDISDGIERARRHLTDPETQVAQTSTLHSAVHFSAANHWKEIGPFFLL